MTWNSMSDFWHMGGYGLYVWGSYAVALVLMVGEGLMAAHRVKTARRAVVQNPDDPIAVNSMLSAYDEKVETMQRLVALQARNDR